MSVKKNLLLYCIIALAALRLSSEAQTGEKSPLKLTLTASTTHYKLGSPIDVTVQVTNTSDKQISLPLGPGDAMAERYFRVVAVDPKGNDLNETELGERLHGKTKPDEKLMGSSVWMGTLDPGQSIPQHLDLSRIYEFKQSGLYKLTITRPFAKEPKLSATSNTIEVWIEN